MNNDLYKNRYKTKSTRLENWNYSNAGFYFITICTKDRACVLGKIENGKVLLSNSGEIAYSSLIEIPDNYDNVLLDEFIIMPNHIHLLLGIIRKDAINGEDAINRVSTGGITRLKNPMLNKDSISNIIRWYKGRTSFFIRKNECQEFGWQSRFYDRIIRDETELNNVRQYILNNPLQWELDKYNPINQK